MTEIVDLVLRFVAPDRPGLLAAIAPDLAAQGWDIRDAALYGDPETQRFFVRQHLRGPRGAMDELPQLLAHHQQSLGLEWHVADISRRMKVVIAVSKSSHCLVDLIHKTEIGTLPIEIVGVVSNHDDCRALVEWHGLPFHHLPVAAATRPAQEAAMLELFEGSGAELLVLARYMQVLTDRMASALTGRCINIHHSFLPSFKGAQPYHQAHARGVKLIGATAHYVTSDLDEGPIIEQDIRRVTHATTVAQMIQIGRETEASVLSRAVKWHAERRIFLNGHRTILFA